MVGSGLLFHGKKFVLSEFFPFLQRFLSSADSALLITFANNLNPDQDLKNVSANLDPNHLRVFMK